MFLSGSAIRAHNFILQTPNFCFERGDIFKIHLCKFCAIINLIFEILCFLWSERISLLVNFLQYNYQRRKLVQLIPVDLSLFNRSSIRA